MSTGYPSSNPFRKKPPASTAVSAPPEHPPILNHVVFQQSDSTPPLDSQNTSRGDAPKKTTKKVRVQSPPPSSPSIPDSSSTVGEETYSIPAKPPIPVPRDENDPFSSATDDKSEDEAVGRQRQAQAPTNPFQKTLETMEHSGREGPGIPPTHVASPGRASMDVEAFKRLLMTGDAGLGISTPPTVSQAPVHHGLGDGGSSTDTSSLSRQSIFEAMQEAHPETPRTSHEISEPEEDSRALASEVSTAWRKKPPLPSSRHGKLIKVELRDDPASIPVVSSSTPSFSSSNQLSTPSPFQRSQTDLNKPLPPAPARASYDSEDRESIFDKESAGKTPEPPSPSASLRRKNPPAPPLARRQSQRVANSKSTNRNEAWRLSPKVEEDSSSIKSSIEIGRPRSNSARAPPPPPTRRPTSLRGSSHTLSPTSSLPILPPTRGSSRQKSSRPQSVASMDISPPISSTNTPNKRASMMPPPPPPPRHGRRSMEDASRRTSADQERRSTESSRKEPEMGLLGQIDRVESPETVGGNAGGQDILAEMSKLQEEIDALRTKSESF